MASHHQLENLTPAKRAVYEIRQLRSRVEELERLHNDAVAIIGMGLRFPGNASTPEAFWKILAGGTDTVTEIPPSRWPLETYYDPDPDAPGKMYARHASLIADPALFDAGFFGISPREAMAIDPQQRLALEVTWEALENAGYNPAGLPQDSAGVFLALGNGDYGRLAFRDTAGIDTYTATGNVFSVAAGRISYALGFTGPSVAVDTACSGSLVAVHLACQSLRAGECRMAVAGGVNLILSPEISINLSKSRMLARDGRCKSFDAAADGYVRAEGCGMVVLKRLSDAEAARDQILAIIRGSAVNQDGRRGGLTVPSGAAQEAVIRQALANARIQPERVGYVEAHGTGTSLGDPVEAHALVAALGANRSSDNPLTIGSVKTNVGHLEAAAGVAGLIKTVLALQHGQIPPHLHFQKLNPHIDWNGTPVRIPLEAQPWLIGALPRVAGVSSFGFSGTNAHVILEEAPVLETPQRERERPLHILALSARTEAALNALRDGYAEELARPDAALGDICYTANAGRAHFQERAVYTGASSAGILSAPVARRRAEAVPEVVFLFPGQGAQYAGMGKELFETQPVFRQVLEDCAAHLARDLEAPLFEVLWGKATHLLDQTAYTQPALFALEYALARLWQSWGIQPSAVLGHSVGEYVAACVAGVYSLADGLKLIAARGRLMQAVSGRGGMLAAHTGEAQVRAALAGLENRVSLAAVNGPRSVVVSGYEGELAQVEQRLVSAGVGVKRLRVSHGFHSPQMAEMEEAFERVAGELNYGAPQVEMISSLSGQAIRGEELSDAGYWRRQVREPVRFAAAVEGLRRYPVFLETGPGTTLAGLGRQCLEAGNEAQQRLWAPSLRPGRGEWKQMLESLGELYAWGAEVNWEGFDSPYARRKVALPTYPFERQRYWVETKPAAPPCNPTTQWDSVCEAASNQSHFGGFDLNVAAYPGRWAALDTLAQAYICTALIQLGAFQTAGESHTAESLVAHCGIAPSYQKLVGAWLSRLGRDRVLRQEGDCFAALQPLAAPDLTRIRFETGAAFDGDRIFLDYVLRCGQNLTSILTGRTNPLETIFPGGEFAVAEDLYERAPLARYFRAISREALEAFVRGRRHGTFRVLEVGAGTGSTASALLPVLPPEAAEYHFTDVSDAFLNYAKQKFAAYPFVRYGRLNIELDGAPQSYAEGSFDVVAATNVLHATRDIRAAIGHVKSLLAPGGILILCEATEYLPWFDVTTALIEGWQRFEDGIRGEHPLLAPEAWKSVLLEGGFEAVSIFPEPGSPAEVLGQRVILARTPMVGVRVRGGPVGMQPPSPEPASREKPADLSALLDAPPLQRHENLVSLMRQHIAAMLRLASPDRVERKRRLKDLGLDSLMALEFSKRLTKSLNLEVPLSSTLVFDYPTLDALADYVESDILHLAAETGADEASPDALEIRAEEIAQLADAEVEAMLLEKLQSL
jgi:acyl transferase domain-containing protein/SAM-dependent methyltransferase/acyl carrier protein